MDVSIRLRFLALVGACANLLLAACAAPLGPGYSIKKQSLEVRYLAGDPPRLEVRARYQLKNTGNRNLASLELGLPGEKDYGRKNLQATLDSGTVSMSRIPDRDGIRVSFSRPWAQKEEHELALDYELTEKFAPYRGIAMAGDSLVLTSASWYPILHPPEGLFGKGGDRQNPLELALRVPEGYRAHSSGRLRGVRKENGELVYRFRIGKNDPDPFIVAGRYHEQRFHNADATIVFWALRTSLSPDEVRRAGEYIAASVKAFETNFGPLSKKPQPYWVVEAPSFFPYRGLSVIASPNTSFPGGALYGNSLVSPQGGISFRPVEFHLAESWFQQLARPQAESKPVLMGALGRYAVEIVEIDVHGEKSDRQMEVRNALQTFEAQREKSKEKPLLSVTDTDPQEQIQLSAVKAGVFLTALEDRCGKENLRQALRHMVQSLRGSSYGYSDLRSALEQECKQDLGPMFHEWLTETGIPADFRRRYEAKP